MVTLSGMRDACISVDHCITVAILIVLLNFEILEDKHCLGVGGFDRAIIGHLICCYLVILLATYYAKHRDFAHI